MDDLDMRMLVAATIQCNDQLKWDGSVGEVIEAVMAKWEKAPQQAKEDQADAIQWAKAALRPHVVSGP